MRGFGLLGGLVGLTLTSPALAQNVSLEIRIDEEKAEALGLPHEELNQHLGGDVDHSFNLSRVQQFMDSMAQAAATSNRGMGVDYTGFNKVIAGASVGSAAHGMGITLARPNEVLPPSGFAAQVSGMVGVNLGGLFGAEEGMFSHRVALFANGLALPMPSASPVGGFMYNAGFHAQLRMIGPYGSAVTRWGGLFLTAGIERSSYTLSLKRELPLESQFEGVDLTWTADGTYRLSAVNDAIPLELSTSLQIAVVSVYGGAAMDFNTGSSTASAELTGRIHGAAAGERVGLGDATLRVTANGVADPEVFRLFGGLQVNVAVVRAYAHVNVGLDDTIGAHAGVRIGI